MRDGARSIDDVGDSCGAGTRCGGCVPAIESILTRECPRGEDSLISLLLSRVRSEAA